MTKQMKALHVVRPRCFSQIEATLPDINAAGTDRLIVQPSWVSMCGSDIPFFTGSKRHRSYPLPVGAPIHECYGKVIESTSDLFKPDEHVVAIPESDQGLSEFFVAQAAKAVKIPTDLGDDGTSCLINHYPQ
jgi:threonine dehydrogenase-like Zn-dependent dehydrogenase